MPAFTIDQDTYVKITATNSEVAFSLNTLRGSLDDTSWTPARVRQAHPVAAMLLGPDCEVLYQVDGGTLRYRRATDTGWTPARLD